jgi:hypothetical protein
MNDRLREFGARKTEPKVDADVGEAMGKSNLVRARYVPGDQPGPTSIG